MALPAWISEVGIAGTWVIAFVAIWGERIRALLFNPYLQLDLLDRLGELVVEAEPAADGAAREARLVPTRYYRLRVTNARRFPAAHEVEVLVTSLEMRGPDGEPQRVYSGPLPLKWRHQELYPRFRTIGHKTEADAELLFIRDGLLQLMPMAGPNNFPSTARGETHLWITLVARGLEGQSKPVRLQIDWDGNWERGDAEMARHFHISRDDRT